MRNIKEYLRMGCGEPHRVIIFSNYAENTWFADVLLKIESTLKIRLEGRC